MKVTDQNHLNEASSSTALDGNVLRLSSIKFFEWGKDGGGTLLIRRTRSLSELATLHSQSELERIRPLRLLGRLRFMAASA